MSNERSRARESRAAIERLYVSMRHLFNRGGYKPFGMSGMALRSNLLTLHPEIYGSMADPDKVELAGLEYVVNRLPKGIEECRFVKLSSDEGLDKTHFDVIIPAKRRRNCYRIDKDQMNIEVTRGRSEIYDILTHLTFMYIEAEKIKNNSLDEKLRERREWIKLREYISEHRTLEGNEKEVAVNYLSTLLGRTYDETERSFERLNNSLETNNDLFHITYWLGKLAMEEANDEGDREITFTASLRERIGHHIYGERWAINIKNFLIDRGLFNRPLHIISANMHSVMNSIYAFPALKGQSGQKNKALIELASDLSEEKNTRLRKLVEDYADNYGMHHLADNSGTNLEVQIIDTAMLPLKELSPDLHLDTEYIQRKKPVLMVLDYAFGEQAFEIMDELLKPMTIDEVKTPLPVESISILGKAGILNGEKGDLMIPNAHIFEGTADNYPFENALSVDDFKDSSLNCSHGPMITVLGTSLQNRDILEYFKKSSWGIIGLEMEGAHFQKAIQAASRIRKSIRQDVVLRYAYYASDNPLVSGGTLASGSLGLIGVEPTYLITKVILNQIAKGRI